MNAVSSTLQAPQTPVRQVKTEPQKDKLEVAKADVGSKDSTTQKAQSQALKVAQAQVASTVGRPTDLKGNNVNLAA